MITTATVASRWKVCWGLAVSTPADQELLEYAVDGVVPKAIVKPKSAAEVVEIVQFAASEGLSLIASGSRSKMELGMPPSRFDIAVDMRAINQIAHFDAGDLTLSVDAGMQLSALEKILAEKQQFCRLLRRVMESPRSAARWLRESIRRCVSNMERRAIS